jgi:hypothetical protein
MRLGRRTQGIVAAAAIAGAIGGAGPARAGTWDEAGWGALATLSNLGYMPAKLVYATFGMATGGLAYVLTAGDSQTAETIWTTSMGGTYVLTPRMLRGEDPIAFAGTSLGVDPVADAGDEPAAQDDAGGHQIGRGRNLEEQQLGGS